eukprot:g14712.t1
MPLSLPGEDKVESEPAGRCSTRCAVAEQEKGSERPAGGAEGSRLQPSRSRPTGRIRLRPKPPFRQEEDDEAVKTEVV